METKGTLAGRFRNRDGSDLTQMVDSHGRLMYRVDSMGNVYTPMLIFPDGSTQESAAATTATTDSSDAIDVGTF